MQGFTTEVLTSEGKCIVITLHVSVRQHVSMLELFPGRGKACPSSAQIPPPVLGMVGGNGCGLGWGQQLSPGTGGLEETFNKASDRIINAGTI